MTAGPTGKIAATIGLVVIGLVLIVTIGIGKPVEDSAFDVPESREMWMRTEAPECRLQWTTLAGIGRVESKHGSLHGATIGADGQANPPIIGRTLDGSRGLPEVADTDRGDVDGDPGWDHAVGPMQLLPATWQRWRIRALRDGGRPDPQHIDDAALVAARWLCATGGDLSRPPGWWRAVLVDGRSVAAAQEVYSGAQAYAAASLPSRSR
ncbi:MAG: murein transglycosylase [Haloechinothrix sp.]